MFVTWNMSSLASSSLLIGYHQDVNLAAYILSLDGTFVSPDIWERMAKIAYPFIWEEKYGKDGYEKWFEGHRQRCNNVGIELYSGKSLYSTLLPEDYEWSYKDIRINNGILVSGVIEKKTTSGSSGSIGMKMYRTYPSEITVNWINGSYHMLNEYLIIRGITLGFPHITLNDKQKSDIKKIKDSILDRPDLLDDTEKLADPVIRARMESKITQELDNVREKVSVEVMNPKELSIASIIRGKVIGSITLYKRATTLYPMCEPGKLCLTVDPYLRIPATRTVTQINPSQYVYDRYVDGQSMSRVEIVEKVIIPINTYSAKDINQNIYNSLLNIEINLNIGIMTFAGVTLSMGIFPRIEVNIVDVSTENGITKYNAVSIDRSFVTPNALNLMIESGARGNATNAIQIVGIVGQQSYQGGRINRMLVPSCTAEVAVENSESMNFKQNYGPRTMPCYPFDDNTPVSRGFVSSSYVQGLKPDEYMSIHVASRENLTANQSLTPRTGYFERRMRTFAENLRISVVDGKYVVTNERGIIVMWDYIFDPSKLFSLKDSTTFVDLAYELANMSILPGNLGIYMYIPYRESMSFYYRCDQRITALLAWEELFGYDFNIGIDPMVFEKYPDFVEYLRDILPKKLQRVQLNKIIEKGKIGSISTSNINVFSLSGYKSENQRLGWFMGLTDYKDVLFLPSFGTKINRERLKTILSKRSKMNEKNVSALVNVNDITISGLSYPTKQGEFISIRNLTQMITYGSDILSSPLFLRPKKENLSLLEKSTPLEVMIMNGGLVSI